MHGERSIRTVSTIRSRVLGTPCCVHAGPWRLTDGRHSNLRGPRPPSLQCRDLAIHRAVQALSLLMQPRRPKHSSVIEVHVGREDRPKTHARGRRCSSCRAILSIYNEGSECWACHPTGRQIFKNGGQHRSADVVDMQELMEDAA